MISGCFFPIFALCMTLISAESTTHMSVPYLSDDYINHINSIQNSWTAGRNFEDSPESVKRIKAMLGELPMGNLSESLAPPIKTEDPEWPSDVDVPATFDARVHWKKSCPRISEIWDQGNCGSCWAVAGSSAVTDRYCISSKGKFQDRMSTQHLFCCAICGDGCMGGYSALTWEFFKKGLVTGGGFDSKEGCQPYEFQPCNHFENNSPLPKCSNLPVPIGRCKQKCTNKNYELPFKKAKRRTKNNYTLKTIKDIQKDIMTHGPVTMAFVVYEDFLSYKSGVYKRLSMERLGRHAVRVIGWGTERGLPYWLILNSWNEYWGDNGQVKVLRGSNHCEIESNVNGGVPRRYK
ncbi:cathepsin B [Bemisia tabaci]